MKNKMEIALNCEVLPIHNCAFPRVKCICTVVVFCPLLLTPFKFHIKSRNKDVRKKQSFAHFRSAILCKAEK